ncbi:MAG: hypothetical protein DRJ05_01050 [Bacteroidetes bacterium]|nr:MAG: hypothetical protein DRJ05_01050 [Bacteroidota bacterium]
MVFGSPSTNSGQASKTPPKLLLQFNFIPSLKAGANFSPSCPSVQAGIIMLLPARINSFRRVCQFCLDMGVSCNCIITQMNTRRKLIYKIEF